MNKAYFEKPISYDEFIGIMRGAKERVVKGIVEKIRLYAGLECSHDDEGFIAGASRVKVVEEIVEPDYYIERNFIPPVELSFISERMDRSAGDIGLGFYYSSELEVHTVTIFSEVANYSRLRDYIYNYRYSYAEFLLKELEDDKFVSLLIDELFFQLFWNIPELNYHLIKSSPAMYTKKLVKEIKLRRFFDLFYGKGFTVSDGQIYCHLEESDIRPQEGKLLLVRTDKGEPIFALYEGANECFRRVDSSEQIAAVHFWRYADKAEMGRLLAKQELKEYKRYILHGDAITALNRSAPAVRAIKASV